MQRYRGQKSLYEAMAKARLKQGQPKPAENLRPQTTENQAEVVPAPIEPPEPEKVEIESEPVVMTHPKAEAGGASAHIVDTGRRSHGALQSGKARGHSQTPSKQEDIEKTTQPVATTDSRAKSSPDVEPLHKPAVQAMPEPMVLVAPKPVVQPVAATAHDHADESPSALPSAARWRKPRPVQFHQGRIEFALPYPLAAVVGMGLIVALMAMYRLGQNLPSGPSNVAPSNKIPAYSSPSATTDVTPSPGDAGVSMTAIPMGRQPGNVVVIMSTSDSRHLGPLQEYFRGNGIEMEIVQNGGMHELRTVKRFVEDPVRYPNSDGGKLRRQLIDLGKKYTPPQGYLGFNADSFDRAYGKYVSGE